MPCHLINLLPTQSPNPSEAVYHEVRRTPQVKKCSQGSVLRFPGTRRLFGLDYRHHRWLSLFFLFEIHYKSCPDLLAIRLVFSGTINLPCRHPGGTSLRFLPPLMFISDHSALSTVIILSNIVSINQSRSFIGSVA